MISAYILISQKYIIVFIVSMVPLIELRGAIPIGEYFELNKIKYELIGTILGLAIFNGVILDIKFPLSVYKKLLGKVKEQLFLNNGKQTFKYAHIPGLRNISGKELCQQKRNKHFIKEWWQKGGHNPWG